MAVAVQRNRVAIDGPVMVCLALALVIGLIPRIIHVSVPGMYFDECCSWKISQFALSEMLDAVSRDAHPPLYYLLLKAVGSFVGDSPVAIRGVSIVCGLATIAAVFFLVRAAWCEDSGEVLAEDSRVERDFAAVLAALLVAGSALQVELSLQGRPYTLGTLVAVGAALFVFRATRPNGTWLHWAAFAVAACLLSLTHYYGLFTVGSLFLFAVTVLIGECYRNGWSSRMKQLVLGAGISAWCLQLAWLFWLPIFFEQQSRSTAQLWMRPLDWGNFCSNCWMALAAGKTVPSPAALSWLAVVVWGVTVAGLLLFGSEAGRLVAFCAGGPLVAVTAYGILERNILGAKYLAFAQVFLPVGWALLAARIPWRPGRFVLAAVALAWSGFWCWRFVETRDWQATLPGVCGAVEYLGQHRQPEEPVIVGTPFIFVVVQKYATYPQGIYVSYTGDHRSDMLGGPPLRESEYVNVEDHFSDQIDRAWTVDVFELFGPESRHVAQLPAGWRMVRQKQFREAYGLPCVLAVREYRRQPDK